MRRPRPVTPEERDLWHKVARTTQALHSEQPKKPDHAPKPVAPEVRKPLPDFRIGETARPFRRHDLAPTLEEALAAQPVRMDHSAFRSMTRGKLHPEGRIDLHGMTLAEARQELVYFILNAHAEGRRLVLVITGKGKRKDDDGPIPARIGALRHEVPHWLSLPPLRPLVLQVATAHLKHGGSGAYYVYLRRAR
ncbi:Smr/MutS family protein [Albidovulum sediminicola]|uniref:Smr/MutS family protein n=1 Tax=Albidovulum sediminicola TaxID=2984331 RepID=A0ABT2YWK8_9RHOB|nr:Smr/MutS family protein [Defluviimonas sp. WL0075]MCV2863258.1 Smr/MutS family protein [Defluviimonas sp. WL0075]